MKVFELTTALKAALYFLLPICQDEGLLEEQQRKLQRSTAQIAAILSQVDEQCDAETKTWLSKQEAGDIPEVWKRYIAITTPEPSAGLSRTKLLARVELAKDLLRDGYSVESTACQTLLSRREVRELAKTHVPNGNPYPIRRWLELIAFTEEEFKKTKIW